MFSYIVTGVFFVYNSSVMILFCVFAVYGAYAMIREAVMLLSRKSRLSAAVRIGRDMDAETCADAIRLAEQFAGSHRQFASAPVLLCEAPVPQEVQNYGYEIYVRRTETEEK